MALTRCPPIGKLGLPGPRQLEEREEVAGVPVPVQVGVQTRLLAPRRVPRAVLEAQLIVDLQRSAARVDGWQRVSGGTPSPPAPATSIPASSPLTWRGSGAALCGKRCLKTTAASTLPERLSDLTYSSKSRSEAKP